jgi:hypothetical protein
MHEILIAHNFIDFALEKIPLSPAQITLPYIKPPTCTKKPLQTESLGLFRAILSCKITGWMYNIWL